MSSRAGSDLLDRSGKPVAGANAWAAVWNRPGVRGRFLLAAVLAICAAFMLLDFRPPRLVVWDESRIAVSALEMRLRGLSLVTTYDFRPDLWNTKPPLLIWLMWASMQVFGPSAWAIRLPSMLAAAGTLALTMSFVKRVTGSAWSAALAAFLFAASPGFQGHHGARTGDFDALLCFFTTAYLYLLFFEVHRRRPRGGRLLLAAAAVAGAVMTKSVAGLVPGVGVAAYLLLTGRWRRPFQSLWYVSAVVCTAAPVAVFVLLRERAGPGYLQAAFFNDMGGRFRSALDGHGGPPWFYVESTFVLGFFSSGWATLLTPLGVLCTQGVARRGLVFSLCVVGCVFAVLSLSATKLNHYVLTAYPFIATASAVAIRSGLRGLADLGARGAVFLHIARALLGFTLCIIAVRAVWFRTVFLPGQEFKPQAAYGDLLEWGRQRGLIRLKIVDGGVLPPGPPGGSLASIPRDYEPLLRFYTLLWTDRGVAADRIAPEALGHLPAGSVAASCDPRFHRAVLKLGPGLAATPPGCVAVRVGG